MPSTFKRAFRPIRKLSDAFNRLPFAGKPMIRSTIFWIFSGNPRTKIHRVFITMGFLALMAYAHYLQLNMGLQVIHDNPLLLAKIVGFVYSLVNAMAVLTQITLFFRVLSLPLKRHFYSYQTHSVKPYGFGYLLLTLIFTSAGQFVFLLFS